MFNYRLFCGVRPRKFVVAGQIGPTKKHLPEVTGIAGGEWIPTPSVWSEQALSAMGY